MILVSDNMNSFKQHHEEMRQFRESHHNVLMVSPKTLRDLPVIYGVRPPQETGLIRSLTNSQGKLVIVPIWKITLARGIQN